MKPVDIIGRELNVGDYVVFTNSIYVVQGIGKPIPSYYNFGQVRIMLASPSKTTRAQVKNSGDMCLLPKDDVLIWLLKKK